MTSLVTSCSLEAGWSDTATMGSPPGPTPWYSSRGPPRYYARFGFVRASQHDFRSPSLRIPDPAFQALKLPAYEPWMTGTPVYAEPFWHHDCGSGSQLRLSSAPA